MKLRNATLKDLNITWYLSRKPYARHTDYDLFYLDICRHVFEILGREGRRQDVAFAPPSRQELMDLAYTATAYFEDRVNGIGLWDACLVRFREAIGKPMAFLQEAQYDAQAQGDIRPADLKLLFFITRLSSCQAEQDVSTTYPFIDRFLEASTSGVYAYLDGIDEIEETDFYRNWLDVRSLDFAGIKERMTWLAQRGYMFGSYLSLRVVEDVGRIVDAAGPESVGPAQLRPIFFQTTDEHSFKSPSSLLGIYPADVLALACNATDRQRKQIEAMKNRVYGNFSVGRVRDGYRFRHTITGESFLVDATGLTGGLPLEQDQLFSTTLAGWGDRWHISGMCIPMPEDELAESDRSAQNRHCAHHVRYREKLRRIADENHAMALGFFGAELTEYPDLGALETHLAAYGRWHREQTGKRHAGDPGTSQLLDFGSDFPRGVPVALFLPPHDGPEITIDHAALSRALGGNAADVLAPGELAYAAEAFADDELSGDYWRFLRRTYGSAVIEQLVAAPVQDDADFEALLRIYKPDEFSERRLPRYTLTDLDWDELNAQQNTG